MSQAARIDVNALWKYVIDQTKARTNLPALWRAMEAAHPITLENDELVLGYTVADFSQSHLLLDTRFKNTLEQVLEAATRRRLRLKLITGDSLQDWEAYKVQQIEGARLQAEAKQQYQKQAESGATWDAVGEQLVRKFSSVANRGLASVQGRYLEESLGVLTEAYARLMPESPQEVDERNYSRALERLAERVNVPGSLIAYMVQERLRK
jgi:hypothetical protein